MSRTRLGHVGSKKQRQTVPLVLSLLLLLGLSLSACGTSDRQQPQASQSSSSVKADSGDLRVALILPGVIQDADFNFIGYQALQELNRLGLETKYQENVTPADAERIVRGFINDGYNVIMFHGGQFLTHVQKLAPDFPDVTFVAQSSGPVPNLPQNTWIIGRRWFEAYYSIGVLAANTTKSNKIGVLSGIKLPEFVAVVHTVRQAVQKENPNAKVLYSFVGDQNDPVAARQAAEAMIRDGADFIIMLLNLGSYGVMEAAKGKPVLITTFMTDKHDMAPKNLAGSVLADFSVPWKEIIRNIQNGQRAGYYDLRPGHGLSLSKLYNVPEDAATKAQTVFDKVARGEIKLSEDTSPLD